MTKDLNLVSLCQQFYHFSVFSVLHCCRNYGYCPRQSWLSYSQTKQTTQYCCCHLIALTAYKTQFGHTIPHLVTPNSTLTINQKQYHIIVQLEDVARKYHMMATLPNTGVEKMECRSQQVQGQRNRSLAVIIRKRCSQMHLF